MSMSGRNAATFTGEKLRYEDLGVFLQSMRAMHKSVGPDLKLWRADIDSASRRIPITPTHRQYAHVVFKHDGKVIVAKHLSLMFGAVSSVYHWERVGASASIENLRGLLFVLLCVQASCSRPLLAASFTCLCVGSWMTSLPPKAAKWQTTA